MGSTARNVFVKLQGSYAPLDGHYKYSSLYRHLGRALQLLTGAPLAAELNYSKDSIDMVYDVLVQSQELCYARIAHCRQRLHGLHSNHGYSLLWVGQVTTTTTTTAASTSGTRLVSLRNPHGRGSYTGNYGLGSSVWDSQEGKRVATQLLLLHCFERCPMTYDRKNNVGTWRRKLGPHLNEQCR
jgi:Calpain family cysteine protease